MAQKTGRANQPGQWDADQAARAAWLHFVGGLTQSEVAKRLGIPNTRAHRHIARAQADGLVRVFVDIESSQCVALESRLMERFGLSFCRVAMDVPETGPLPLRALSAVGATYLMDVIGRGEHQIIGVGNGRTLSAAVEAMSRIAAKDLRFVSMLGGLTRSLAANPYDVIHWLAQKTGAEAHLLPAPLYADSPRDKQVMMKQTGVAATMALIDDASLALVGIGGLDTGEGAALNMALGGTDTIRDLTKRCACAELLGQFIGASGAIVETPYDARAMAPPLETLRGREVVAIAGGECKAEAIAAALRSGLLTGLIVDEATARRLAETPDADVSAAAE